MASPTFEARCADRREVRIFLQLPTGHSLGDNRDDGIVREVVGTSLLGRRCYPAFYFGRLLPAVGGLVGFGGPGSFPDGCPTPIPAPLRPDSPVASSLKVGSSIGSICRPGDVGGPACPGADAPFFAESLLPADWMDGAAGAGSAALDSPVKR